MADPKIRYDIEADVKGSASADQLEESLRALGQTLEGDLKRQADEAANALQQLGAKRDAIVAFQQLNNESNALAIELAEASTKVEALAADLPVAAAAAQRFAAAETAARASLDAATADLVEQQGALSKLRQEFTGAARNTTAYKEANAQLRVSVKDLKANLDEKKAALQAAASASSAASIAEKKLATDYEAAAVAAFKMRASVQDNANALAASRNALQSFSLSTDNLAQSERNLTGALAEVRERVAALAPAFTAAASASSASAQRQMADQRGVAASVRTVGDELRKIQAIASVAIGGGIFGGLIKDVAQTADEFKNLQARVGLATGEGKAFEVGFKGVQEVALATNSSLNETATLFSRIAKAGTDAGLSSLEAAQQSLALTETINQAVQLSGSGADASKAAITQLIQGLQSGVLRGEEFNSVMEQAPRLAQALAQGLGVTTGELRKLANQGTLTTDVVIRALTSQAATVEAEFGKLPATVGRALTNLSTQWSLYVGSTDKGFVSSANLAKVIDGLAKNLDLLVGTLGAAAKAYAAVKIAGLAADAVRWATATATATTAVVANTAALGTNTIAHTANAAAQRASAAAGTANAAATVAATGRIAAAGGVLGRFSFLLGPIGVGLAAITPEIVSLGQALGEGAAKWVGYGKVIKDAEDRLRLNEEAAKSNAAQQRLMAVALQEARDRQFELSKESIGLIGKFDEMRIKGDSAADAVGKIGKDFDLASVPGIANAGAVLDKLLADGKITATQFRDAWADALKGEDLAVFETRSRAAFAGAAREGERLAAVMDGTAREAIRRTGLEFDVLAGGAGRASRSAINDTDAIVASLDRLKAQGVDTGLALTASIGKGIETADSERSITALRAQISSLRGQLGDRITDGLLDQLAVKASELRARIEEIKPGIQSVAEAMRLFGLQSQESLAKAATNSREAYELLKTSGTANANQLREAFTRVATDAIAANKGIQPSWLATEDAILRAREATESFGRSTTGTLDRLGSKWREYGDTVRREGSATPGVIDPSQAVRSTTGDTREQRLAGQNAVDASLQFELRDRLRAGQLSEADLPAIKTVIESLRQQNAVNGSASRLSAGFQSLEGARDAASWQATRAALEAFVKAQEAPKSSTHNVKFELPGGEKKEVAMASEDDAKGLVDVLKQVRGRSS